MKTDLEIVIGLRCNNNCVFCSNRSLRRRFKEEDHSTSGILRWLEEHRPQDHGTLHIVGGEPTIHKDLFRIIGHAKSLGYKDINLMTNGRMLSDIRVAGRLAMLDIKIGISVHGDSAGLHDTQTRAPGSFDQLCRGMDNLGRIGWPFETHTVMNRMNLQSIVGIIDVVSAYHPSSMLFSLVSPIGMDSPESILADINSLKEEVSHAAVAATEKKQTISFNDVPRCVLGDFHYLAHESYESQERFIREGPGNEHFFLLDKSRCEKEKAPCCSSCIFDDSCAGFWKGYSGLQGLSIFSPVHHEAAWSVDEKTPVYALKAGLKRAARLEMVRSSERSKVISMLDAEGFHHSISDEEFSLDPVRMKFRVAETGVPGNYLSVFVSKEKNVCEELKRCSAEEISCPVQRRSGITRLIGELLGYPSCCVAAFAKTRYDDDALMNIETLRRTGGEADWRLNNLINPYSLIDFYPCSYACSEATAYAERMIEAITLAAVSDRVAIKEVLRRVVIYLDFNRFIAFRGRYHAGAITYDQVMSSLDVPLGYRRIEDPEFIVFSRMAARGDTVVRGEKDGMQVFCITKGGKKLHEYIDKGSRWRVFDFSGDP